MNKKSPKPHDDNTLAEEVTARGMLHLDERVVLPPSDREIVREVMQATVEVGMLLERQRLLEHGDN
jgi:hypothetical protein